MFVSIKLKRLIRINVDVLFCLVFKEHNWYMERVMRIELTTSAWKAEVLPLNYTRKIYGATEGNRTLECRNHNPMR